MPLQTMHASCKTGLCSRKNEIMQMGKSASHKHSACMHACEVNAEMTTDTPCMPNAVGAKHVAILIYSAHFAGEILQLVQ